MVIFLDDSFHKCIWWPSAMSFTSLAQNSKVDGTSLYEKLDCSFYLYSFDFHFMVENLLVLTELYENI